MNARLQFTSTAIALAVMAVALAAPVAAATPGATSSSPHCSADAYHQLDFWIGDWDTFETEAPTGPTVARARVEPIVQGCALHELYEQFDGLIGDSILSYDPVRKQWQQTWVTNFGSMMMLWGGFKNGALVLEGESHMQSGKSVVQRITWKPQDDGVRESAELSKDGGKTWAPAFDVLFKKRGAKLP